MIEGKTVRTPKVVKGSNYVTEYWVWQQHSCWYGFKKEKEKKKHRRYQKELRVATMLLGIGLIKKRREKKGAAGAKVAALLLGKYGKSL